MRAMVLAAVLVAAASFSSHAASLCSTVDATAAKITSHGDVYLGVADAYPIAVPETLGADKVITAIIRGSLWRIPVDAAGCAAATGFEAVDDVVA